MIVLVKQRFHLFGWKYKGMIKKTDKITFGVSSDILVLEMVTAVPAVWIPSKMTTFRRS